MSRKILALFGAAALSLLFAGCSGGGATNPMPSMPSSDATPGSGQSSSDNAPPITTSSTVSSAQGYLLVYGYIDQVGTGMFHINGGTGVGHIWVHTSSSTHESYGGLTPRVGEYAVATGTGSLSTSVTAVYAALYGSAVAPTTISGKLTSTQPYGFAIRLNDGKYVPLALSSKTSVSGNTAFWEPVTAYAVGSEATGYAAFSLAGQGGTTSTTTTSPTTTSPTPPPSTVSSTSVQRHLLTADYLQGLYGTTKVSPAQAAPYLNWAQTTANDANGISAAGIKTEVYVDPNWMNSNNPTYKYVTSADYARTCTNSLVGVQFGSGALRYDINPNYSASHTMFATAVNALKSQGHIDMIFEDNPGPLSGYASYPNGKPCNYSDSSWINGTIAMNNAVSVPVMINGLNSFNSSTLTSRTLPIMNGANTLAGNLEGCYSNYSTPVETGTSWIMIEDTELAVNRMGKTFQCMARYGGTASSNIQARMFTLASFLLSYNPSKSILQEEFGTPSGLHVFPESELVALNPLVSTPSSVTSLREASGAYGRQYGACYLRGAYVGACAVAVSRDAGETHAFPFSGYSHTLVVSGNGVLDGGTVSASGPAPGSMPAGTGIIAFK